MKLHATIVAALALWLALAVTHSFAESQQSAALYNPARTAARATTWPPANRIARYQSSMAQPPADTLSTPKLTSPQAEESLPTGSHGPAGEPMEHSYPDGEYSPGYGVDGGYGEGYPGDGYSSDDYCGDAGYCDTCGNSGADCSCGGGAPGCYSSPGKWYVTADYLYVRSTFSEAVSFLEQNDDVQNLGVDTFHELEFDYESSYRFGGGYRLCDCCEEIRFMFTRMGSHASDVAPSGSFIPFEAAAPPGGQTFIDGDVDLRSYDLEYAKTIPLGGSCECGDACCAACCPTWDITWSGGVRFAEVETSRRFTAVNDQDFVTTDAIGIMTFEGGGPRFGMQGRRYFGPGGCMSAYLKGDVSLLLGHIDLLSERTADGGSVPDLVNIQTLRHRQLIPVTEIEAGFTGHVTRNSALTAGYLFHAWHDLGFRDTFNFPVFLETSYDDANILGFDGLFARLEVSF